MKKVLLALCLCTLMMIAHGQEAAREVALRILGDRAQEIVMSVENGGGIDKLDADFNWFSVKPYKGKIVIAGDNDISLCMGLNYYLRHVAKVHVSWYASEPIELPSKLPKHFKPIHRRAEVEDRFFLNYCTFGYTMAWWGWKEWERFIDWMALNGINMPLSQTGQEAVWYEVWKEFGMTDEEIRSYFSGPAHLPWHRMANLDGFSGPLPMGWIEGQKELEKQILGRERALGMKPVMPAFAGHVPRWIAERYPSADIKQLSPWCGFEPTYFLNSTDSLFPIIQKRFLEKQDSLFGNSHLYGCDPFNEMDPPSWEPDYLASVSKNIYASMQAADSTARWLQMTWVFYYKRKQWTPERLRPYLTAVPKDKMVLLDYFCENTEVWRKSEGFYGQPFVWCYLGNFGGNTMLVGDIKTIDKKMNALFREAGDNLTGIGSTLESFDCSPHTYEYLFERAWCRFAGSSLMGGGQNRIKDQRGDAAMTPDEWAADWADCRMGKENKKAQEAWRLLVDSIYRDWSFYGKGTQMTARPTMKGHGTYYTKPEYSYNNDDLLKAVKLLAGEESDRSSYLYDIVNLLSQWMANQFWIVRDNFASAYETHDLDRMRKAYDTAMKLINDCDDLLGCVPEFRLAKWQNDAILNWAANKDEYWYYWEQARKLPTIWGGPILNDYGNRLWNGLLRGYYGMRWEGFFIDVIISAEQGKDWDEKATDKSISDFEQAWSQRNQREMVPYSAEGREQMSTCKGRIDHILLNISEGRYKED